MTKNQEYALQYADYAMAQMRRYGIPASVTLAQGILERDRKSTRLNSSHIEESRMPSSA